MKGLRRRRRQAGWFSSPFALIVEGYGGVRSPPHGCVRIGSKYGVIHVDRAASLGYNYYVEYEKKWQSYRNTLADFNEEVDEYNGEIQGEVFTRGSPEALSIEAWKERLDEQAEILSKMEKEGDFDEKLAKSLTNKVKPVLKKHYQKEEKE